MKMCLDVCDHHCGMVAIFSMIESQRQGNLSRWFGHDWEIFIAVRETDVRFANSMDVMITLVCLHKSSEGIVLPYQGPDMRDLFM